MPVAAGAKEPVQDPILDSTIDGRYAVEARLGEGGMGVVYKARHVLIDKPVAIKILRKEAAQDAAAVQRFIQEAKSASKINHSNIVDITDFGVLPDGHAYFVMEFLEGKTLAQAIQDGPMEAKRVCNIASQVARGLHAAHTKGIVHRDLKPENIFLLEREGQKDYVKIVDFGIAKVGGGQKLTQVGMVLGTPEYMSPEQATGQETDHRVDQYALGCIMYEMLTGAVPFLGDRPAQTLTKHVFEPVIPPRKRKPDLKIPATIEACVMRALEKKPEKRFPSMKDLDQSLTQVESDQKGGRIVIEDSALSAPAPAPTPAPAVQSAPISGSSYPAGPNSSGQVPAPMPSGYPVPQGQPGFVPPPTPSYYPQQASGGVVAPPFASAAQGAVLPKPPLPVQSRQSGRGRSIVVVVAAVLVAVVGLLIYFVTRPPTPVQPIPPINRPQKVDPPPKVDPTPVIKPPPVVELPPIDLQVLSRPPDAEVYIDGNLVGRTPHKLAHKRGILVRVEVRKRGFEPYYEELTPDSSQTLDVKLEKSGHSSGGNGKTRRPEPGKTPVKGKDSGSTQSPSGLPTGLRDPFKKK